MTKSLLNKIISSILCLVVVIGCFSIETPAYSIIDAEHDASLTISYQIDGKPIEGVNVSVFKVADIVNTIQFQPISPFDSYPVADLNGLDGEGWRTTANTYASYVISEKISATDTGVTLADGTYNFENLSVGLYLVMYDGITIGEDSYINDPVLVSLPNLDESKEWNYDVISVAKPAMPITYREVMKIWKNDNETIRPKSITVQLYCKAIGEEGDFEKYGEPVILNKENQWKYIWEDLPGKCEWHIREVNEPKGYTVATDCSGTKVTLTNTFRNPPPTPTPPTGSKIPQTGTTWYVVPILISIGLLFVVLGVFRRRKEEELK